MSQTELDEQPPESTDESNGSQSLTDRIQEMVPVDWEIVRHAGAEPVPHHLRAIVKSGVWPLDHAAT